MATVGHQGVEMGGQQMIDSTPERGLSADGFVQFWPSGDLAKGEFHCSDCGYGVTVHSTLPRCPMCSGESWERSSWSPLSRAGARTTH